MSESLKRANELESLKGLFLGEDLERLRRIDEEARNPEERLRRLAELLPLALKRLEKRGELNESLAPTVEAVVRLLIQRDSQRFADALYPAIGPAIRKSISETIRQLLRNFNQALEAGLSWQGIKWRFEAWRSGTPYAQVVMLHSLHYRVEQVFLIHRQTGLLLAHVQADGVRYKDPDMVSSMLAAIGDFVRDSFESGDEGQLGHIEYGDLSILVESGPEVLLAVAVRGEAPNSLRQQMQQVVEDIQRRYAAVLDGFNGDMSVFNALEGLLLPLLQARYRRPRKGLTLKTKLVLSGLLLLLMMWIVRGWWWHRQQADFLQRLGQEPGLVITSVTNDDGLTIRGLRDPLARAPEELLAQTVLDPEAVRLEFSPYQSLQREFVHRRLMRATQPPPGVSMRLDGDRLVVSGLASAEWIRRFRDRAALLAGTETVDSSGLVSDIDTASLKAPDTISLDFDSTGGLLTATGVAPESWLEQAEVRALLIPGVRRFDASRVHILPDPKVFDPPPSVDLRLEQGVLRARGEAGSEWIARLRKQVADYPAITELDLKQLRNSDAQRLEQISRSLEQISILFDSALSFNLADQSQLQRAAELALDLFATARKLGRPVTLVIRGHTDSTGSFEDNLLLSLERADFVAQQLFLQGVPASRVLIRGIERLASPEKTAEERRHNRRVSFEVLPE